MMHIEDWTVWNESRRALLLGLGAGSFVLAMGRLPSALAANGEAVPAKKYGGDSEPNGLRDDPRLFIEIARDGAVTIMCIRSEMGQGVRTSMAMVLVDELGADWAHVRVKQAVGDERRYGNQDTDGSRSLRQGFAALRRAGAAARMMLEAAAAALWEIDVSRVEARVHEVVDVKSDRRLGFGELAGKAANMPVPSFHSLRLKSSSAFRYIGKENMPLVDGADIVTGRAQYGIDTRRPGMLYAVVARPAIYGSKVVSFDASAARAVPGVVGIISIPGTPIPSGFQPLGGIAVVADNTGTAIRARALLKIEWDSGPNADYDSAVYRRQLETVCEVPGKVIRDVGDVEGSLVDAAKRVTAVYYIPHLAHASMEPPAAVADCSGGRCCAWACVQAPQAARDEIAKALGISADDVTMNVTLLGGGFGRKSKPDFVVEAALLSQAVSRPVKVTWTREDDIVNDYFHAVAVERLEAGFDASGKVLGLRWRSAAPSFNATFGPDPLHQSPAQLQGVALPYAIPNIRIENPEAQAHTRIGWFRSVYNIPHAFAAQCFIAELSHAAGRDHKEFLLELLGPARTIDPSALNDTSNSGEDPRLYPIDIGRWRRVVDTATTEANWGRPMPKGRGLGLAAHRSFVSYAAVVCEVAVGDDGQIRIPRVDIAFDCGPLVNPERVRSQMEGSVIMGLGLALHGEISFKAGRAEQTNFNNFRVLRMNEAPVEIHVHLVGGEDFAQPLGGAGEPGLPPVAPALANAIFSATGRRIRSLPLHSQLAVQLGERSP